MSDNVTLYEYLSTVATPLNVAGWLPQSINRRGDLPATKRRVAWARRVLAGGNYASRLVAEALGAGAPDVDQMTQDSVERVFLMGGF